MPLAVQVLRGKQRQSRTWEVHLEPHLGQLDVQSRRTPPPLSAMFDALNALVRAVA